MSLQVLVVEARSRQANSQHLQSTSQIINFVDILGSECARPETAPWIRSHQSFLNKTFQGLAYRCATHPQLFSQRDIGKPLFLAPTNHDDVLPELFIGVVNNTGH